MFSSDRPTSIIVDPAAAAQLQQTLSILSTAASAARHTIDSTLDVEKIDSGQMTVELRPTSLGTCLGKVFQLMQPLARAQNISMSLTSTVAQAKAQAGLEDALVLLDEDKIEQVLRNLVSNGACQAEYCLLHGLNECLLLVMHWKIWT